MVTPIDRLFLCQGHRKCNSFVKLSKLILPDAPRPGPPSLQAILRYHIPVKKANLMTNEDQALTPAEVAAQDSSCEETCESRTLKVIGWLSVGITVAVVGIFVGRELRCRYKFKRRTPYDFYSHAGERQASEFGVGI
jgi:hypothetical protein